ncbi:MAG: nuclear transport factor 2 family protein [Candidatus Acidiferrales bacterium]|jgi:ketosteroid isomerase-like protein
MAAETSPQKQSPEDAVRAANQRFYAAYESLDLAQMEDVWAHDEAIECVHPGWELLFGWDDVRESWARIFATMKRVRVALSSLWVRVEGDAAWVACTEHVTTAFADGFDESIAQTTNIFVRRDGEWRMVAHHASPLPSPARSTVQ